MLPTVSAMKGEMEDLYKREGIEAKFLSVLDICNEDLNSATAVMLVRPENSISYRIASSAKKRGAFVITFCDDDLLNLPKDMPSIPWRKNFLKKCIQKSDVIESPSPYICDKYSKLIKSKRGFVVHSAVSKKKISMIPESAKENKLVKLVYAAGGDHVELFNQYILPILPRLGEKYRDKISLTMVGVHPNIEECNKYINTEYIEAMPLEQYRQYMREAQFDIGLAPLSDTSFNRCKYFNKFIEYTLVGVTGIYSDNPPYTYVVRDGENGRLAHNNTEDWLKKIIDVIEDKEYRKNSLKKAVELLREEFNEEKNIKRMKDSLPEIYVEREIKQIKSQTLFYKIEYKLQRMADLSYMTIFYLRKAGVKGMLNRAAIHNKELKKMAE